MDSTSTAGPSIADIMLRVKKTVDDRISAFSSAFFADSRASTQEIADRIDAISDAVLGGCDDQGIQSGASNVSMPTSQAEKVDRLRTANPALYASLRDGAKGVAFANPLKQRAAIEAAISAFQGSPGGAPPKV